MKDKPAPMNASTAKEEALFTLALGKPAAERGAFLDREGGGDVTLRRRVEALLAAHEQRDSVLATEMEAAARPTLSVDVPDEPPDEAVGQTLGRYKLLEKIGEGGCGVVYVAEQTEPVRRRVALKIIKLGMDTKQVVARFEAERQALAMMDHPNIAKILDAGVTGTLGALASCRREEGVSRTGEAGEFAGRMPALPGRPYFVMELVRGIRITDYCDQANLSTHERLDLFIKVCHAIQHAHQKGIIHRDIKPSNILVTLHDGVPVPKVIDFGIAKATEGRLTDATVYTQLHQFIGTPAYMSPEQAEMSGLDIDTRSDIYSLGVLLYELLAGSTPFDAKELMASGIDAMRKTIREREPVRPSIRLTTLQDEALTTTAQHRSTDTARLRHQLQGDLDWIVMKCLEKDRGRRYETANGLAADLKRHLTNEPVVARPPSVGYRFQKAWRRNKLMFTAALAVVVAMLALVALSVAIPAYREVAAARDREAKQRQEKERALHRAELALSQRNLAWADREWQANNIIRVRELVAQSPEADRAWEWHRLNRLCHSDLLTLTNESAVQSVAWHSSGQWLMVAGPFGTGSHLWDVHREAPETRLRFAGSSGFIDFLPGGFDAVVRQSDLPGASLGVANLMTGGVQSLPTPNPGKSVLALSPDGSLIAAGTPEGDMRLFPLRASGEVDFRRSSASSTNPVTGVAFSPNGRQVAFCSGRQRSSAGFGEVPEEPGSVVLWDLDRDHSQVLASGGSVFLCVAFSFDGKLLMAGTADQTIRVWDTANHQWIGTLRGHSDAVLGLSASPNSQKLASCSADQTIRLWDLAERKEIRIFRGHEAEVTGVAFSPNGRCLASVSGDRTGKVWDALAPTDEFARQTTNKVSGVAFDPKSTRVAAAGVSLDLIDRPAASPRVLWQEALSTEGGAYPQVAFDPVGAFMATTGRKEVELRHAGSGKIARKLSAAKSPSNGLAFSPDGTWLAAAFGANGPGEIRIWRTEAGELIRQLTGHTNAVWGVAASPDGRRLASASGSFSPLTGPGNPGEVIVWDVASGNRVLTLPTRCCCYRVAFSPDGRFLASVGGLYHIGNKSPNPGEIKLWDVATGRLIWKVDDPASCIFALAFTPDGRRLATGGGKTKRWKPAAIKLWDVSTGEEVLTLGRHLAAILTLDFSRDGWSLASGSEDGTVRVWDTQPQSPETLQERRRELLGLEYETDARWLNLAAQRIEDTAAANPTNPAPWQMLGRLRLNEARLEAADEAYTHALALAGNDFSLRSRIQRKRFDILVKLGRTDEALAANLERLRVPARDIRASPQLVDLSLHYTSSLTNSLQTDGELDALSALHSGIQNLGGIDFDVRGACQTSNPRGSRNIAGIRVGQTCRRIHFLHAAIVTAGVDTGPPVDTVVGRYVIHRKGLPDALKPLAFGRELGLLYSRPDLTNSAPNVVWTNSPENAILRGRTVRLFRTTWENSDPESVVETLDLMPESGARAAPVLIAITIEEPNHP